LASALTIFLRDKRFSAIGFLTFGFVIGLFLGASFMVNNLVLGLSQFGTIHSLAVGLNFFYGHN
jgi:hypothetical protein